MRTFLIADDQDSVLQTLEFVFTARGFRVVLARSGADAVELARTALFDAALLDLRMPGMDGVTVCRIVRERAIESGRDVPIWIMTATPTISTAIEASKAGAIAVVKKPFDYDELLKSVHLYCEGKLPIPALPG